MLETCYQSGLHCAHLPPALQSLGSPLALAASSLRLVFLRLLEDGFLTGNSSATKTAGYEFGIRSIGFQAELCNSGETKEYALDMF